MIRIFKTDVTPSKAKRIRNKLNDLLWFARWNFDLEDCDRILRIEYSGELHFSLTDALSNLGIACVELD